MGELPAIAALAGPVAQILAIILVTVFGALSTVAWLMFKSQKSQNEEKTETIAKLMKLIEDKNVLIERRTDQLSTLASKTNEVLSASNVSIIRLRDTLESVQEEIIRIKEKCND